MTAAARPVIPRATYRVQLGRTCTFAEVTAAVPYLAALGVSHVYCSPYLKARAGSTHGYDVVDYEARNPEIGSDADFDEFVTALRAHGMGHVLDVVPNHMGIAQADNAWWLDLLEWGRASEAATVFDVDWTPSKAELRGKVLVPFLGDHYGAVLERGELRLAFDADAGTFSVWYHEHRFPITPSSWERILGPGAPAALDDLRAAARRLRRRPPRAATGPRIAAARALAPQLAALAARAPDVAAWIAARVAALNGAPGVPRTFLALHGLLEAQHYRLAYWRVAADEINYRRFFNVNELAGVRVEQPAVFERTHRLVIGLVRAGRLDGLRIDHVDGLFDPQGYCARLRAAVGPEPWIVVEKILASGERLPADWPVAGTTGYDFLTEVTGLLVDPVAEAAATATYRDVTGEDAPFGEVAYAAKKLVMNFLLGSELHVLGNRLDRLSEADWHWRDFTTTSLREALKEVVACFPVYRTYVGDGDASPADRRVIAAAVAEARRRSADPEATLFDFVAAALTGETEPRPAARRFARQVQQFTGPVTAKAVEDTAFYRYGRLLALNEVGGDPSRFGAPLAAFHAAMAERAHAWPHAMLATATHDTKRGEDARARLAVLSELPHEWDARVRAWETTVAPLVGRVAGVPAPTANERWLIYQTMLGSWPAELTGSAPPAADALAAYRVRVEAWVVKALREAKRETSWRHPNAAHEEAAVAFVRALLDGGTPPTPFLADFLSFQARVAVVGALKSLTQVLVKLTAPGVPDVYQGTEGWDFALVDPDNRRPVDLAARARLLRTLADRLGAAPRPAPAAVRAVLDDWRSGLPKLLVLWRILGWRRDAPALFERGGYVPLEVRGAHADRLCAFARVHDDACLVAVAPRFPAGVHRGPVPAYAAGAWGDGAIAWAPLAGWTPTADVVVGTPVALAMRDGEPVLPVAGLLAGFPVAAVQATRSPMLRSIRTTSSGRTEGSLPTA